jgi:hypothetical protein
VGKSTCALADLIADEQDDTHSEASNYLQLRSIRNYVAIDLTAL